MTLLCRLGFHKWEAWHPPVLAQYRRMGVQVVRSRRCPRCGRSQLVGTL